MSNQTKDASQAERAVERALKWADYWTGMNESKGGALHTLAAEVRRLRAARSLPQAAPVQQGAVSGEVEALEKRRSALLCTVYTAAYDAQRDYGELLDDAIALLRRTAGPTSSGEAKDSLNAPIAASALPDVVIGDGVALLKKYRDELRYAAGICRANLAGLPETVVSITAEGFERTASRIDAVLAQPQHIGNDDHPSGPTVGREGKYETQRQVADKIVLDPTAPQPPAPDSREALLTALNALSIVDGLLVGLKFKPDASARHNLSIAISNIKDAMPDSREAAPQGDTNV